MSLPQLTSLRLILSVLVPNLAGSVRAAMARRRAAAQLAEGE